jgi:hypothetical protein
MENPFRELFVQFIVLISQIQPATRMPHIGIRLPISLFIAYLRLIIASPRASHTPLHFPSNFVDRERPDCSESSSNPHENRVTPVKIPTNTDHPLTSFAQTSSREFWCTRTSSPSSIKTSVRGKIRRAIPRSLQHLGVRDFANKTTPTF